LLTNVVCERAVSMPKRGLYIDSDYKSDSMYTIPLRVTNARRLTAKLNRERYIIGVEHFAAGLAEQQQVRG